MIRMNIGVCRKGWLGPARFRWLSKWRNFQWQNLNVPSMLDLCNFVIDYMTYTSMLQIYVKSIRILNISQRSNCKLAVASLIFRFCTEFLYIFQSKQYNWEDLHDPWPQIIMVLRQRRKPVQQIITDLGQYLLRRWSEFVMCKSGRGVSRLKKM